MRQSHSPQNQHTNEAGPCPAPACPARLVLQHRAPAPTDPPASPAPPQCYPLRNQGWPGWALTQTELGLQATAAGKQHLWSWKAAVPHAGGSRGDGAGSWRMEGQGSSVPPGMALPRLISSQDSRSAITCLSTIAGCKGCSCLFVSSRVLRSHHHGQPCGYKQEWGHVTPGKQGSSSALAEPGASHNPPGPTQETGETATTPAQPNKQLCCDVSVTCRMGDGEPANRPQRARPSSAPEWQVL